MVVLTVGANDIGFSDILQVLTHHSQPFDHFETRYYCTAFILMLISGSLSSLWSLTGLPKG